MKPTLFVCNKAQSKRFSISRDFPLFPPYSWVNHLLADPDNPRTLGSRHLVTSHSARVSARSLIGSPRCDFTFIRKVALPASTRCISRQIISRKMSASGAVANVALTPCPTHFLMTHKTASLSQSSTASSLSPTTFVGCLGWVRVYRRVGLVRWCIYTLWDERVVYDDLGLVFGFT